jgi:regulator of protease activity HflC (stomatin/prohibitin superfamily)
VAARTGHYLEKGSLVLAVSGVTFAVVAIYLLSGIRIIKQYESGVVLRWGRYMGLRTAGFRWIIPIAEKLRVLDMRINAEQVPPQDVITRDNVSIQVNAVLYFQVMLADRAYLQVRDYLYATSQFAQTTLRSVLGQLELDDLLAQREKINLQLREIIDRNVETWGVKVLNVEVRQIDLPDNMKRAMARQAEAERERRAKIIAAEGEFQAADKLAQAATIVARAPGAMQFRYLQTLAEISVEKNSTILFPVPIEFMKAFVHDYADVDRGRTETAEKEEAPLPH